MKEQDIQYQAEAFLNANKKGISFKEWSDSKDFQKSDKEKIMEVLTHNSAPESEVMLPFNPSYLQDAINKLFVYYTPENVIRKIEGDAFYGNPPFKI